MLLRTHKTQIIQQSIENPSQASAILNQEHRDEIPVVLVPEERSCFSCYYKIPSGVHAIVHHCGDDENPDGLAMPGLQCCRPHWNHVAFMVTQQSCTYAAPIKICPTADNVMVDTEITLVFCIGPSPADVKKFVYNLGAIKFNEYLAAETEEAIRQLVRATPLAEIFELRGSSSKHVANVLRVLNSKFENDFGVHFTKAAITDVVLNDELRRILQGTTEFKTKIKELDKEHDHNMKLIQYDFQQKLSEKERLYDRRLQDIDADINVKLVNREKEIVESESKREVARTKAQENAQVDKRRAEAEFKVVSVRAQQENEELLAKVKAESESRHIKVDKETEVAVFQSQQEINIAENQAKALMTEAKAEGDAAASLKVIREHNLRMAKLEVTEAIARKSRLVISGDNGDRLISSILDKDVLDDIKLDK